MRVASRNLSTGSVLGAPSVRISRGIPFNPLIAIDLSQADAFGDFRTETFVRCWNMQVQHNFDELLMEGHRLQAAQLVALALEVSASPSLLEDILGCYFDELVSGGELHARGVDATAWAIGLADHLLGHVRLWTTRVEIYKHTWKIKRMYGDTSAVSLAPLYQAFDRTVPDSASVSAIYQRLMVVDNLDEISIPEWILANGIAPTIANVRFTNFLLYNDIRFVSSSDTPFKYLRLNSIFDNFESASAHFDFTGCVEASGFSLRDGIDPESVKINLTSQAVLGQFRPSSACAEVDRDELTVKAFLRSKEHDHLVQGIPAATHQLITDTIAKLGRIVSLRDVRRVTGASRVRLDPFQVDPGPLVVYAPGERYLHGDAVSFALRDWVQDDAHKRGRVAVDRILTPLTPCTIATPTKIRDACLVSSRTYKRAGVVFRHDACTQLKPEIEKQGLRWATERTLRALDASLTGSGLIRSGEAFFDKAAWDLRDAKKLTAGGIRDRIVAYLQSGHAPQAVVGNAELRDRILEACSGRDVA